MIIAGKCPPEKDELAAARERGFENVELYLERHHVDNFERSLENCREAKVNIVSVHTPHVTSEEPEYFNRAGDLAEDLDAKLVFHSGHIHHFNIPELEEKTAINADYGYENNPGVSTFAIENLILGRGHNMVLDTAHLFIGERNFMDALNHFVNHRSNKIEVLHLCDSTVTEDGLPFGEGSMDMKKTCKLVSESKYDGIVVLEVMPEYQAGALEKWRKWTSTE
jgi:sugar phosphate isomerase/epimerase